MSKTLAECHMEIVKELEARGEPVYNPTQKTMLDSSWSRPKVYVKGRIFPSKEFLCGTAIREKDESISILAEAMADLKGVAGFKIEDLGLCDPVLYYANHDQKTYPLTAEVMNDERPTSGGELVLWLEEKIEKLEERVRLLELA